MAKRLKDKKPFTREELTIRTVERNARYNNNRAKRLREDAAQLIKEALALEAKAIGFNRVAQALRKQLA